MPLTFIAALPSTPFQPAGLIAQAVLRNGVEPMPQKKAARFPRQSRLLRHADFQRVYKQGRRHFSTTMTVFYFQRDAATPQPGAPASDAATTAVKPHPFSAAPQGLRIGFTVGRVLGGAVVRNRMKRRLREAVRITLPTGGLNADVVINPKKSMLAAEFTSVVNEVSRAFAAIAQKLAGKDSRPPSSTRPA